VTGGRPGPLARTGPRTAAALLLISLTGCTADPAPSSATTVRPSAPAASAALDVAALADDLRDRIRLPPLPSFAIPTDVLTGDRGQDVAEQLDVLPGLYRDIAVLDARCGPAGEVSAADAGDPTSGPGARASVDDGTVQVSVAGDGTGVYDAPGVHIAVLGDGTGVYEDEQVRLTVQAGGAGTYVDGERRSFVRADRSGSFRDATSRLWVEPDGSGGYDGPEGRVTVDAQGKASGTAEPELVTAVTSIVREGLPLFPAVPLIRRTEAVGQRCGTVVRLDAGVLFAVDSAELRPDARELLDRVADLLARLDHPTAQVVGHTDSTGERAYNQSLSERRAQAVSDRLVGGGVPVDDLEPIGRGEDAPVVAETGPDGQLDAAAQQLNRRVEVVLRD
jgi:OOP family OmpA-OmpF porin